MSLGLTSAGYAVDGRWLVRGIDVSLSRGELLAVAGPNGSGKSTALRLLAGVWTPSEGQAVLDGTPLPAMPKPALARQVALVPQDTHVAFAFTVREVVAMGRHPHLGRFARERAADRQAIQSAIERADVAHLAERRVNELSGGERQRVLIARSLATDAAHILLDEPTASLDVGHALAILALCRRLADEGRAIAMALHDLNAARRFATHGLLLHRGRAEALGPVAEVLTAPRLAAIFGVPVELVAETPAGPTFVFPDRPASSHH